MTNFTTQQLANHRAIVSGTDSNGVSGKTVVSTEEFDRIQSISAQALAAEAFDATVEAFYAPLIEAADRFEDASAETVDPVFSFVVQEGTEGTERVPEVRVHLSKDSVILRLIAQHEADDRLVWVGDELEILEKPVPASTPALFGASFITTDEPTA